MTQEQINKLQELKKLLDAGILTEEEMQTEKAKILGTANVEQKVTTENKEYSAPETTMAEDPIKDNDTNTEPDADQTAASVNSKRRNIILAVVGIVVVGLVAWAISSKNKSEAIYSEPEYNQIESVDEGPAPVMETNENETSVSDATTTDDDEFSLDPWIGGMTIEGGMYRTCDSRCYLNFNKTSRGLYTGSIVVMLGSTWPDHPERFDPSLGYLEGNVRAKADGDVLTVVMDRYTSRVYNPNTEDTNYFENSNISGQIFRITYDNGTYIANAVGDMEGYFDNGISITK